MERTGIVAIRPAAVQWFCLLHAEIRPSAAQQLVERCVKHPKIILTPEQIEAYSTVGGTPHLDYSYTVFGELLEGMDVLDLIAAQAVDKNSRPVEDVKIIKMYTQKR